MNMKNGISFTTVLSSKRQHPKTQFSRHQIQPPQHQYDQQLNSLAEYMEAFEQNPDQQYILSFSETLGYGRQSNTSVFDSKDSKGNGYGTFDSWIAVQAKHENKENLADTQPRMRQKMGIKGAVDFIGRGKNGNLNSQRNGNIRVESKAKLGIGKLCKMFDDNQIESEEPVWKCPQIDCYQSSSSEASYSEISRNSKGQSSSNRNFQSRESFQGSSQGSFSSNLIKNSSSRQSKQSRKFTDQETNDLKARFTKISNDKIEQIQEIGDFQQKRGNESNEYQNIPAKLPPHNKSHSHSGGNKLIKSKEDVKRATIRNIEILAENIVRQRESQIQSEENEQMLLTEENYQGKKEEETNPMNELTEKKMEEVRRELTEILKLKNSDKNKKREEFINQEIVSRKREPNFSMEERADREEPFFNNVNVAQQKNTGQSILESNSNLEENKDEGNSEIQVGYSFAQNFKIQVNGNSVKGLNVNESIPNSINNSNMIVELSNEDIEKQWEKTTESENMRDFKRYVEAPNSKIQKIESVEFGEVYAYQQKESFSDQKNSINIEPLPQFPENENIKSNEEIVVTVEKSIPMQIRALGVIQDDTVVQEETGRVQISIQNREKIVSNKDAGAEENDSGNLHKNEKENYLVTSTNFVVERVEVKERDEVQSKILKNQNKIQEIEEIILPQQAQQKEEASKANLPENSQNLQEEKLEVMKVQSSEPKKDEILSVPFSQTSITEKKFEQSFCTETKPQEKVEVAHQNELKSSHKIPNIPQQKSASPKMTNQNPKNSISVEQDSEMKFSIKLDDSINITNSINPKENPGIKSSIAKMNIPLISSKVSLANPPSLNQSLAKPMNASSKLKHSLMKQSCKLSAEDDDPVFEFEFDFD